MGWGGGAVKDLIQKMLTVDPAARITIDAALAHPWMLVRVYTLTVSSLPAAKRQSPQCLPTFCLGTTQDAATTARVDELLAKACTAKAKLATALHAAAPCVCLVASCPVSPRPGIGSRPLQGQAAGRARAGQRHQAGPAGPRRAGGRAAPGRGIRDAPHRADSVARRFPDDVLYLGPEPGLSYPPP